MRKLTTCYSIQHDWNWQELYFGVSGLKRDGFHQAAGDVIYTLSYFDDDLLEEKEDLNVNCLVRISSDAQKIEAWHQIGLSSDPMGEVFDMTELSWVGKGDGTFREIAAKEILEIMGESRNALAKKFTQREEIVLEAARASLISQSVSKAVFTLEHENPLPQQNFSSTLGWLLSRLEALEIRFSLEGKAWGSYQGAAQIKIPISSESVHLSPNDSVLDQQFLLILHEHLSKFGAETENLHNVAKFEAEIQISGGTEQEVKNPWRINIFAFRKPDAELCEAERFSDIVESLRQSEMKEFRGLFETILSVNDA